MMEVRTEDIENGYENNGEEVEFKNLDFSEKAIRQRFIRKVYGILTLQFLIYFGFASIFMYVEPMRQLVVENLDNLSLAVISIQIMIVVILLCTIDACRRAPGNIISLGCYTLGTSFFLGLVGPAHREEIYWALGMVTTVIIGLTIFAWQGNIDFNIPHKILLVMSMPAILLGSLFLPHNPLTRLIFPGVGAFVYCLFLFINTHNVVRGKHMLVLSPEEYVFAALILQLDILTKPKSILRAL
ncbi:protein lifeguard 1-like [Macrosteles quadrilineatus]|uniref:protein lifeguard 1-like n=1 Tax=Macrosteles quadrilineatus TaxID=74068 RepID=UPI0023E2499A|nr:protein lifeguard 1-like [Macrosteles quadrilineatus]XP_054287325.1 protein lifeguard 1-like [Macrosteles quadrilineatus]XP_054287326.1 protein lifeguard 1-like [Macrosteles quadrilineatus]